MTSLRVWTLEGLLIIDWTEVQPYYIVRAYGSFELLINHVGMAYFVKTDFNPLDTVRIF